MRSPTLGFLTALLTSLVALHNCAYADALAKLQPDRLAAVRRDVLALRSQRQEVQRATRYQDYRANLHVHSALSHDSRGSIDEIVAAAKTVGTKALLFNEHPADRYDYFADGHQGVKDGVLLIPGAETKGFLVYPAASMYGLEPPTAQEFADLVRRRGGLAFLSHVEERMDWEIRGLSGVEIYNTHADVKDEKRLLAALRNPLWLWQSVDLLRKYPQEAFSALQDYPADYLRRWDQLCQAAPHCGVAANDSHQNVGVAIKLLSGDKVRFEDALGEKLLDLNAGVVPGLANLLKDKQPGDTLFQIQLDTYENSLRHVGTHLLMTELSRKAVWEALEAGRAYVAFDWLGDATGFDFTAVAPSARYEMGSRFAFDKNLRLRGHAPLPGQWKLLRDGKVVAESTGRTLDVAATVPGNYRVEVWLQVAGEKTIWILANPIYINPAAPANPPG